MSTPTECIFVDESGDPGLKPGSRCHHFTVGFVYCASPNPLRKKLRRLLKRSRIKRRYPPILGELKFYLPETDLIQKGYTKAEVASYRAKLPLIRSKVIELIDQSGAKIFAAIVDKSKAKATWTQERLYNFAFANTIIINVMNAISPPNIPLIFYDKGRMTPYGTRMFAQYLLEKDSYVEFKGWKQYRGSLGAPNDVSSLNEPGIWAADIVAGAYFQSFEHNDPSYANMFRQSKLGVGHRLYW